MFPDNSYISIGLVFFPALLNASLLIYLLVKFPRNATVNVFALFLIAMIFWQVQGVILRFELDMETVRRVDQILSIGWMAVGLLFFHFAVLYTKMNFGQTRLFYFMTYGVYLFFYVSYHSHPFPPEFFHDEFWGYYPIVRKNSFDMAYRIWTAVLIFLAMIILYYHSGRRDLDWFYRKQSKMILLGVSIPAIFGFYSHVLLPLFSFPDVPLTAILMTTIPIFTIISLSRYRLFNYFENLIVEELFVKLEVIIMLIDDSYRVIYMNPLAKKLFAKEESHIQPFSIDVILNRKPGGTEKKKLSLSDILPKGGSTKGLRVEFLSNKGEVVPVLLSTQVIRNNFMSSHTLILAYDLSEINKYEEELRVFNEKYNLLLKATNEAIFDIDIQTRSINWGGGYKAFFGKSANDIPKSLDLFFQRIHKDDVEGFRNLISTVEKKVTNVVNMEYRVQVKDKNYAYVLQRSYILSDALGNPVRMVGALKDVTLEKEHLRELTEKNEKLKQIAWVQSHEVRRPLSNILGLIDMLRMDSGISDKERKVILEALKKSSTQLDHVIHQIVEKSSHLE